MTRSVEQWLRKFGWLRLIWSEEGYEKQYVQEAFDTNWVAPLGPNVTGFENEIAAKVGSKSASATTTGIAAIHLALKSVGVKAGDIVFCQSLTFSATANLIIYESATPVFIDSNYETWNMDPNALEEAFKKYPDVKAVLVVHLYGLSADMDKIMEICTGSTREQDIRTPEEIELLKLRKENKQLKMENDILKQAALIFAQK